MSTHKAIKPPPEPDMKNFLEPNDSDFSNQDAAAESEIENRAIDFAHLDAADIQQLVDEAPEVNFSWPVY